MEVSESDAQKESVSELRRILKISGLVTKKEVAKMGYLDLWGFVHQVVRGRVQSRPPPTSNPSEVSELLRAGLLGRLIRFLIDFSSLNSKCKRRLFPASTWCQALLALGSLAKDIKHHVGPEFRAAEVEWCGHVMELVESFKSNPHILAKPDEEDSGVWCVMCLASLKPLISGNDDYLTVSSHELALAALNYTTAVRSHLTAGPASHIARQAAILSVEIINGCLRWIHKNRPREDSDINVAALTGLSYDQLIRQCLDAPGNGKIGDTLEQPQIYSQMHHLSTINILLDVDHSPALNAVVSTQHLISYSATLMKAIETTPQYAHDTDPNRDSSSYDWHDSMILMWRDIFVEALERKDERPAVEAFDTKVVFLLEIWSVDALENQIDVAANICELIADALAEKLDAATMGKFYRQVEIVSRRMASRPGINPRVVKMWKELFAGMNAMVTYIGNSAPVCGRVGCVTADAAQSVCSACKKQSYCSPTCQRADWKEHKRHCSGKKK